MVRRIILAVAMITLCAKGANAGRLTILWGDEFDKDSLIADAQTKEAVKAFAEEVDAFFKAFRSKHGTEEKIERAIGKPSDRPAKTYAMLLCQPRLILFGGTQKKGPIKFYEAGGVAAIEVYYGPDGKTPDYIIPYLKTDKEFPRLTNDNLDQRLAWDRERFAKLVKFVEEREKKK